MTQEQAKALNRLFEDGYTIQIEASLYVTGNVYAIDKVEDTEDIGDYVYSDEIMDSRPLSEVFISEVKVLARVDWLDLLSENNGILLRSIEDRQLTSLQYWNQDLDEAYENN